MARKRNYLKEDADRLARAVGILPQTAVSNGPGTVITITFEDHGQDFLQWDICNNVVIDCRPFQASVWVNCRLLEPMTALRVGHRPLFMPALEDMDPMRINYPIEAVEVRQEAENIPCYLCAEDVPAAIAQEVVAMSKDGEHASFTTHVCPICGAPVE